jgi:hypothetical protein
LQNGDVAVKRNPSHGKQSDISHARAPMRSATQQYTPKWGSLAMAVNLKKTESLVANSLA